jgi:hypothetical protein
LKTIWNFLGCFWKFFWNFRRIFLEEFFGEDFFWKILLGGFFGRTYFGGFFCVCQDLDFCQDFDSMQGRKELDLDP